MVGNNKSNLAWTEDKISNRCVSKTILFLLSSTSWWPSILNNTIVNSIFFRWNLQFVLCFVAWMPFLGIMSASPNFRIEIRVYLLNLRSYVLVFHKSWIHTVIHPYHNPYVRFFCKDWSNIWFAEKRFLINYNIKTKAANSFTLAPHHNQLQAIQSEQKLNNIP